jgi:hypothetical protein
LEASANSNEGKQPKKPLSKFAKVVILETAFVLGCIAAAFTLPPTTLLRNYLIGCAVVLVGGNLILFRALRGPADSNRKVDKKRASLGWGLILVFWILFFFLFLLRKY